MFLVCEFEAEIPDIGLLEIEYEGHFSRSGLAELRVTHLVLIDEANEDHKSRRTLLFASLDLAARVAIEKVCRDDWSSRSVDCGEEIDLAKGDDLYDAMRDLDA